MLNDIDRWLMALAITVTIAAPALVAQGHAPVLVVALGALVGWLTAFGIRRDDLGYPGPRQDASESAAG